MPQETGNTRTGTSWIRPAYINEGMSRIQFAARVGLDESTVRRLERGQGVSPASAKRIADHFDCKVTDLLPIGEDAAA